MTDRSQNSTTLSIAWEQSTFAANRPIACEVTFTAPQIDETAAPRLPLNVGLSIDRSGSMAGEKLAAARKAAIGVAESMKDGERLAAVAFDNTSSTSRPASRWTRQSARASPRGSAPSTPAEARRASMDSPAPQN